jgi:hypothetical protein
MKLSEVIEKLNATKLEAKDTQIKLNKLNKEISSLFKLKDQIEVSRLVDYIQIGDEFEVTRYMGFKGIQTGKDTGLSPTFRDGDKIQFVKKNSKSIVIKCLKKIVSKNENGTIVKTETNPDTLFRIDIDSLYYNLMSDVNYKTTFYSYIKRKESLEELGI